MRWDNCRKKGMASFDARFAPAEAMKAKSFAFIRPIMRDLLACRALT